jgi:hypothetical protein
VPDEVVNDVLEVARWSGSASDRQPWELVAVHVCETLRAGRRRGLHGHLAGASLETMPLMAGERPAQETYDEGRLSERIMLAAHEPGVGSSIGCGLAAPVAALHGRCSVPRKGAWCAPRSRSAAPTGWRSARDAEHGRASCSQGSCTGSATVGQGRRKARRIASHGRRYGGGFEGVSYVCTQKRPMCAATHVSILKS